MALPTVGAQSANRLAQMLAASAQQKRGLAMQAQFGGIDERRRKLDRIHALLQQRAAEMQAREARKKAEGSSKGSKIGAGIGAAAGFALAPWTLGASLALTGIGAGAGAGIGGMFDTPSSTAGLQNFTYQGPTAQQPNLMGRMEALGLLQAPTETPIFGQGGGS